MVQFSGVCIDWEAINWVNVIVPKVWFIISSYKDLKTVKRIYYYFFSTNKKLKFKLKINF